MSREIEQQTAYLNSLSERDLFVEHLRMSLSQAIDEVKFIKLLADKHQESVPQELDRLHTTLASTRYMLEYHRPW